MLSLFPLHSQLRFLRPYTTKLNRFSETGVPWFFEFSNCTLDRNYK